ncbi:hypothetical protein [Gemmata obscuriglobus]|uniref:hypothetical protein n=1 Tax=Gemmata obscuriglobus TaxID=114 RepID=UPI00016C4C82|nr:hypothetical protein [Gemmata obscuriglobus]
MLYNGDTSWSDIEVVVVELHPVVAAARPVTLRYDPADTSGDVEVTVAKAHMEG